MKDQNVRPGRPAKENSIPIPAKFDLKNYDALEGFNLPRPWLEQFAYRIDMIARWRDMVAHNGLCSTRDEYFICNDIYLCDFYSLLKNRPILPFAELVEQCRNESVELPASEVVIRGLDPVRPMTWLDPITAFAADNRFKKMHADRFVESIFSVEPYPHEEMTLAMVNDDEHSMFNYPEERESSCAEKVHEQYLRRINNQVKFRRAMDKDCAYSESASHKEFLDEPIAGDAHHHQVFFSVDMRSSDRAAVRAFLKHLRLCRQADVARGLCSDSSLSKRDYDMTIDAATFQDWRDIRVLPYIDLMIFQYIEQTRLSCSDKRIEPQTIERKVYELSDSDSQAQHGKVKSHIRRAKRLACALTDTSSKEYCCLLYESSNYPFGNGRGRRKKQ